MSGTPVVIAFVLSMVFGPSVIARLIAWLSRSTRGGKAAAAGAMLILLCLARRGGQGRKS